MNVEARNERFGVLPPGEDDRVVTALARRYWKLAAKQEQERRESRVRPRRDEPAG